MPLKTETAEVRRSSLGWMIQRLASQMNAAMTERLGALDLNLPQFAVMMTVLEHGPLIQTDIGRRFGMPAYSISRALDSLEAAGHIERRAHPASRRAHEIHAAPSGRALAPKLFAIVGEVNAAFTQQLDGDEQVQLIALLVRVLDGQAETKIPPADAAGLQGESPK